MQKEIAEILEAHCNGEIYEEYSGRGMYGKTTTGFVVDNLPNFISEIFLSLQYITEEIDNLELDRSPRFNFDSLGRQTIIY